MTERRVDPNQNKSSIIAQFISSLPCWWLASKGLQAALLPSKNPEIFELYSYKKAIALVGIIIFCMIYLKFVHQKLSNYLSIKFSDTNFKLRPIGVFITIILIVASTSYFQGVSVGEDISGQVKSAVQYQTDKTQAPNFLSEPDPHDLSKEISLWSLRPPSASWLPLFGLSLGMTIGQSIWITLLLLCLLGGVGWIRLSNTLGIDSEGQLILACFLGLYSGLQCNAFGTMNCVIFAIVPWMILWAKKLHVMYLSQRCSFRFLCLGYLFFYLCLGSFVLLKLSALIVAFTIGSLPFFFVLFDRTKKSKEKAKLVSVLFLLSWFLIIPFKLLEKTNETLSGKSSDEMYSAIDYNEQSLLWGNHFTESTKGPLLFLSMLGGSGYAMSPKQISHSARDFFLQFEDFRNWTNNLMANPHVLICGFFGLVCTSLLLFLGIQNRLIFDNRNRIIFCSFCIIPFLGLSIVSYKHGFNYTLYATHTIEYFLILIFPTFLLLQSALKFRRSVKFLFGLCVAIPISIHAENFIQNLHYPQRTTKELELDLMQNRFSHAIEMIEKDSNNSMDVLYFMPRGNSGDLILRTNMRTMAIHFAGDNLGKKLAYQTSRELNVYCAYDSQLLENQFFTDSLDNKFPQGKSKTTLFSKNVIVDKINLVP
jgi:hypothetical protein